LRDKASFRYVLDIFRCFVGFATFEELLEFVKMTRVEEVEKEVGYVLI